MQSRFAASVAAFLAVSQPGAALTVSTSAESSALSWLRVHGHGAPSGDDLEELKTENPMAYGIVKALLMKRSLGLLDPRHPTASFAKAPPTEALPGAEAFVKMGQESGDAPKVDAVYPDAPMPAATHHGNWMNWKPQEGAMDDEAMVSNVLGSVAQLKGGQAADSAPHAEKDELTWANPTADVVASIKPIVAVSAPPAAPVSAPSQENPYLASMDSSSPVAAVHPLAAIAANSNNYLASFSWDDKEPAEKPKAEVAEVAAAATSATESKKPKNALLSWLR